MPRTRPPYSLEFRQQMVELVEQQVIILLVYMETLVILEL